MTPDSPPDYCMRGHRVPPLAPSIIKDVALRICEIIRIHKKSFRPKTAEKIVARFEEYGIHVDVVEDEDWIDATRATVDPQKAMIYVPHKLYGELCRGRAEAVRIFLHELGHIVLGHRPMLHFSEGTPSEHEDSEWQADYFADAVLEIIGMSKADTQLEFKF